MDNKKEKNWKIKIFRYIFFSLLISFSALYISGSTGYYEFEQHKQVELNEEKIKKFEEDVKKGKDIDIKDYIDETNISYENLASSLGYKISDSIESIIQNGISSTFNFLNSFFDNK